jgi:hypothetical protein
MPGVVEVEDEADQSPFVILSPRITGGIVAPFFSFLLFPFATATLISRNYTYNAVGYLL